MSKWYPSPLNNIFVIPDIHGGIDLLKLICDRILPLRKSDGGKDKLIFLGDYIDRHVDSHKVIDFLIELERKYGEQVIFLMGNHELMFLEAFNYRPGKECTLQHQRSAYNMWLGNGGYETLFGYMQRAGIDENLISYSYNKDRVKDLIPKEHIDFLQRLLKCYELDEYVFVHGGLDPYTSPSNQELDVLVWDRSLIKFVLQSIDKKEPLNWDKIIVTGHNVLRHKQPIINEKFLMLDCGSPKQLLVTELKSMEAYMAIHGNNRLVKQELKETEPTQPLFNRVDVESKS